MPSLTPSQRVFGVGLTPIERAFRPPQGMENDPAYNDYARRKFAAADMEDAQRGQVQEALASQEDARAQRAQDRQMQDVEQRATEALRGKSPEEIPNILAQFPELARSRNLGGFTNFAQAVTPSAGQRTLAPSLRSKLPPAAVPYFEKRFSETGDALDAKDYAERVLDQEKFVAEALPDIMAGGGTMEDVQKIRSQIDLGPIERAAFRESWKRRGASDKDDFRAQKLKGLLTTLEEDVPEINSDPNIGPIVTMQDILNKKAANYDLAHKIVYPEKYQQPQAPVTPAAPVAGQVQQNVVAPQTSQYKRVMAGGNQPSVTAAPEQIQAEINAEIDSPNVNEDFLTSLTENHNVSIEQRKKALDKFRAFAANPPIPPGSTLGDVLARKDKIAEQLKRAEKAVKLAPERDKYIQAWNDAKQDTAKDISRFAKSIGADDASVINSLAKNEIVEIPGRFNPETEDFKWNVRDLFYDDQSKRLGVDARRIPSLPNERLEPFQKSEFAKELGVESFTLPGFRRIELGSGKKTYDDVLNAYLQERAGNTPAAQVGLPRPSSPEEAAKLPPGTKFLDPNGKIKEVPLPK